MDNTKVGHFPPSKRYGLILHGIINLVLGGISGFGFLNLIRAEVGLPFVIYLLMALLAFAAIPFFGYRAYALFKADYYIDRDSLAMLWGLRVEDIPMTDIEWVRPATDLTHPLALPRFMRALRRICDEKGWLFMVDEVQCGIGRTGTWFAFQHAGIRPDVMTLAKGLGSGVPAGACLAAGKAAGVFKPGNHRSTFGGNPLACVAALTTLEVIEQDGLMARAVALGDAIRADFREKLSGAAGVADIRGAGLMIGIELDRPCGELVGMALEAGLLINVTVDKVVRLLPPLVMTDAEAKQLVETLAPLIRKFLGA